MGLGKKDSRNYCGGKLRDREREREQVKAELKRSYQVSIHSSMGEITEA